MLRLLRENNVNAYTVSPRILSDPYFLQRITESAYPRQNLKSVPHLLALSDEELPKNCRLIAAGKEAKLAACD